MSATAELICRPKRMYMLQYYMYLLTDLRNLLSRTVLQLINNMLRFLEFFGVLNARF